MASIDCQKMTAKNCGGMKRHLDDEIREKNKHANKHINQELTHLNTWIGCKDFSEMDSNMHKNITELDRLYPPKRVKSDRNINVSFYMVCPKELTDQGKSEDFFRSAYDFIDKYCAMKYGQSFPCGMVVHRDEVHDYLDHGWKERTSLEHGHMWVTPYAKWIDQRTVYGEDGKPLREAPTESGKKGKIVKEKYLAEGLNCKHFLNQSFLKELQQEFDKHVFREFGIHYMTGEKALHMSVEELKADSEQAKAIINVAEKERDRVLEQAKAYQEGGSYTNEQGEYEFVSYDESIKHLESTKEHLTDNARAYKEGGWYYDYDSELGVTIPEGGIDHLVSEAAAESERITADANEKAEFIIEEANRHRNELIDDAIDDINSYKSSQMAQIDQKVEQYEKTTLEPLKAEYEPLKERVDNARDELDRTLDRIHYYKGEPSKNSYGRRNEDGSFEKAMTLPDVNNEIASQQEILTQILIDIENQTVKKKSLDYGSLAYQLYCQDWAIDPQNVSEVDFATILGGLGQNRLNISDLPLNLQLEASAAVEEQWDEEIGEKLSSLNRDIDDLDMHEILNSALTNNLVLEVQSDVIGQLHRAGMLNVSPLEANMKVDHHKIIDNLKDKLQNFVEQVKEHAKELVERTFYRGRGR